MISKHAKRGISFSQVQRLLQACISGKTEKSIGKNHVGAALVCTLHLVCANFMLYMLFTSLLLSSHHAKGPFTNLPPCQSVTTMFYGADEGSVRR